MKFIKRSLTAILFVVMTSVLSIPIWAQSVADIVGAQIVVNASGLKSLKSIAMGM